MFKFILPIAAIMLLPLPAIASEITCGVVSRADAETGRLTLSDGSVYRVAEPAILKGMAAGRRVRVTINDNNTVGVTDDNRFSQSPQRGGPGSCLQP